MLTFIIIAVIIIAIIILVCLVVGSQSGNTTSVPTNIHSREYRADIYNNTPAQYRQNIRHLYESLDTLDTVINRNKTKLNSQATQIAHEVLDKATKAEQEIKKHWELSKQKADFYYYIGLHYTSFTLADRLTEELDALRMYSNALTKMINSTQSQIDILKEKIERGNSSNIAAIKTEHRELCKKCDALRKTREVCNRQKDIIKKQRDNQNLITGQRRDYIGTHFGNKGKQWRSRIMAKHHR